MSGKAIVFRDWEAVLQAEVPPELRPLYREVIVKFRYWLRQTGKGATEETFKAHLDWKATYLPPGKVDTQSVEQNAISQTAVI